MGKTFKFDEIPAVSTKAGKVKGYFYDKTYIFKGIPYAQAKRFQMPTPVEPWEGEFEAASYGMACPMLRQDVPRGELFVPHRYWPMDENCQNLNVWTKSLESTAKKPVLVWLHGGGFSMGSSIEQVAYDGANLCNQGDLVVVSINHRLNILGYFDMEDFGEKYKNSANVGHADMVMALKLVNENIANFGGDPNNVTIFGQSGGGMKCTGLMQIPEADGLFHKAIIMSGVSDGKLLRGQQGSNKETVEAMMAELGFDNAEQLETVPYYELAQAYNKVCDITMQAPKANDWYLGEPLQTGFTEHAKTIPFMVGTVFGEFAFAPLPLDKTTASEEEITTALTEHFGNRTPELIKLYKAAYPNKSLADLFALDRVFRVPSKALAKLAAEQSNAPAYLYNFTLEFPFKQNKIAWHCSDIPYFFHNTDKVEVCAIPDVSEKLEKQIFGAVKAFAYTGNPNHEDLPNWPPVKANDESTMIFDRNCEVRHNYDDELMNLIEEIAPPFRIGGNVQH